MGRPKRLYPLGKYRLRTPKESDKNKAYPIELEYTWNRQIIRKTTNVFVKETDWNQNGNQGRGEIRVSYGSEYKRLNQLLLARVDRIDSMLAEYNEKHPNQITADIISGFLADKPLTRPDQGKDFVEFTLERLYSEYSRNKIGRSRYENGKAVVNAPSGKYAVIFAAYDSDGKLISVAVKQDAEITKANQSVYPNKFTTVGAATGKVMLWDNLNNMVPRAAASIPFN